LVRVGITVPFTVIVGATVVITARSFESAVELPVRVLKITVEFSVEASKVMMVLVMIFIMSRHKRRKEQQSCQRQNGAESFLQTRLHTQLLSVRFLLSIPTLERQKGRTRQSLIDQRGTSWIERLESRRGILCMHRFRWSRYTTPWTILLGCALAAASLSAAEDRGFVHPDQATTYIDPVTRSEITVLIDQYLGGTSDLTIARLTLPPGVDIPDHVHQSTEIFYILAGELEQTSEGTVKNLTPGMACVVPANTTTRHRVISKEPVHALVIWTPAGEEKRITADWQKKPSAAKE
jgi:quercetin dioxygenase-like cupin family protein